MNIQNRIDPDKATRDRIARELAYSASRFQPRGRWNTGLPAFAGNDSGV